MISSKKKIYIVLIIWGIFFGVLIRFGLLGFVEEAKKASDEITFQKKSYDFFQLRIEDFKNFQKSYPLYQSILEKNEISLVNKEVPIEFIKFLEKEAEKSAVSIEISPLNIGPAKTDPWFPVGFQITVEGTFSDCLRFLERVEQSSWLIEISQLNVNRISKEKDELEIGDASFVLKFKVLSEEPL